MLATNKLYLLLFLIAAVFCFSSQISQLQQLGLTLNVLLLLLVITDYFITPKPVLLKAEREVADRLSIGRSNPVAIKVRNNGAMNLTCQLTDNFPRALKADQTVFAFQLAPSSEILLTYLLFPNRRGLYQFGNIYLRYFSMLGLFWRQVQFSAQKEVKVYNDLQSLIDLSIKLSSSTELGDLPKRKKGQGTGFASLKEYVHGDDSRSIDWKATARRDRPIVRTYEAEQEQRLFILIDAGRMMISELAGLTKFDHALNAALALALTGLTYNDQVGLGIFADKPLVYLPGRRSKGYLKNILEATASIEPKMVEPDYAGMLGHFAALQKSRCLFVLFTDLSDPGCSSALLTGLTHLSKRHLTLCITIKDKQVDQLCQPSRKGLAGALKQSTIFQRAVAIDLREQRQLTLGILRRQGCLTLDEPPEDLSQRLLDRYLEIKAKARL